MKILADMNIPFAKECFSSVGDVELVAGREITAEAVAGKDVLLVRSVTTVNEQLLRGSRVRFVGTATIGYDHVHADYLRRNNIGFASAPGSNANSAAEYIMAALLEIGRKYQMQLEGKSIGVIGVGNVGDRVAAKCEALGMRIYRNDPPLQRQTGDPQYLPIEALYDCDFITLHTPLTLEGVDRTFHLANARFFKLLKRGCVFLNASRGGVHNTTALKSAIRSSALRAVVLDVWENEPDIDVELLDMVELGTPHIAGYSLDGKIAGMIMIYKALCQHFGLEAKYSIEDFLPAPDISELRLDARTGSTQELLANAIEKIYSICTDDEGLREIIDKPAEQRGHYFDKLRRDYPVRREFHNTEIVLTGQNKELAAILRGIGFKVVEQS
jgi:erythronate-4-phosphate dehydrogenase